MAGKIFVNYRRDDARDMAARIRDRLAQTFGHSGVFMDVDNLLAGQRFDKELEKALGETDVFLCVIGPRWMELLEERRRERDYVREEIAGALQRGIVVIPVLIERAPLPRAEALPGDIRDLVLHQKHAVTHEQFGRDLAGLVEAIRFGRRSAPGEASGAGSKIRWVGAITLAALVLGGGVLAYQIGFSGRGAEGTRQQDQTAYVFGGCQPGLNPCLLPPERGHKEPTNIQSILDRHHAPSGTTFSQILRDRQHDRSNLFYRAINHLAADNTDRALVGISPPGRGNDAGSVASVGAIITDAGQRRLIIDLSTFVGAAAGNFEIDIGGRRINRRDLESNGHIGHGVYSVEDRDSEGRSLRGGAFTFTVLGLMGPRSSRCL